ncbi:SRPBCC family protein [Nocardioides jiangxiensis]|uniref:SRPBCC family protein n=1 Tax=Nocardioides jiangxiensis TaxID=3064524 RepID=A0ABT9AZR9_9ACTN|nr:SRPBCC family protein [Nocardioides sp. WY-20]MDO7867524.1 SRPBCC family protein [Nocardioides sp. WY-20]
MRHFDFASAWTLPHPASRVYAALEDVEHYPAWWPQVVACLKVGEDEGVVLCRSSLPYTLELHVALLRRTPEVLESSLGGDLDGWVRWRIVPAGDGCRVHFEQSVDVTGRVLGLAARIARPLLLWNHARMLDGAREGLLHHLDPTG